METFYSKQNIVRNVIPCMTTSISGYNEVHSSNFNDFQQANSTTIKAKKRKWNAEQSIYDINCYSGIPKRVVPNELHYQQRPSEDSLSILKLDLSALCPGHSKDARSSKNPSLNEHQSEKVLSLLGPLFTPPSESPTKEPSRKTIPLNSSPCLNERSMEEALALPELGLSPKRHYKSDLNLFNSESTCLFNSKPAKTSLNYLNQVFPKLNRERYVEIEDPMEITN
ncbi:13645_t:CDS:1 [Funneliformis mosseae]|uniref:13645_t:CDS:1 n=1 Tax=Funneliformis mosseae TaxID=27381 RepID=A0A9N9H4G9_FUNMO|nr:13645_t:CDS:1 [Funneliformis mosseae]